MSGSTSLRLRVDAVRYEAQGTVSIELVDPDGARLPTWTAGAHLTVRPRPGLERQYSLCGDPRDARYRIAVRHRPMGRGGSDYITRFVRVGTTLGVSPPSNHFALEPSARYLFIAGGIGITPILPMMREATAPWRALVLGRSRASMPFLDEAAAYGDAVRVWASDERGRCRLDDELADAGEDSQIYICGPAALVDEVTALAEARGMSRPRTELFAAPDRVDEPGAPFDVQCVRSARRLHVPAYRSLLDVLVESGLPVHGSCREGICGTCEVRVLGGSPQHRDHIHPAEERDRAGTMAACVSRSLTPELVLDV